MDQILESVHDAKEGMIPGGKRMSWQMSIIDGQPQTIGCPYRKGIECTLTVPSTACLTCDNYIVMKKGPGAL